jgi:hypothetical protein
VANELLGSYPDSGCQFLAWLDGGCQFLAWPIGGCILYLLFSAVGGFPHLRLRETAADIGLVMGLGELGGGMRADMGMQSGLFRDFVYTNISCAGTDFSALSLMKTQSVDSCYVMPPVVTWKCTGGRCYKYLSFELYRNS